MRSTWCGMIQRCTNEKHPSYGYYGGRGIKVCKRWVKSFDRFCFDMGLKPSIAHSIDRIDNDGDYTPKNCRWATPSESALNKKRSRPSRAENPDFLPCRSIAVNGWIHHEIKMHCVSNGIGMKPLVEGLLKKFLDDNQEARQVIASDSSDVDALVSQAIKVMS